jgi:hypothetical protein
MMRSTQTWVVLLCLSLSGLVCSAETVDVVGTPTKGWSFWEAPGIKQVSTFFEQAWAKTRWRTGRGNQTSSFLSQTSVDAEPHKDPLKLQAIRYLAGLDWQSYPDVIDTLLASLDDPSEPIRYEALRTLEAKRRISYCLHQSEASKASTTNASKSACDCFGCLFQKKVIDRLSALLLAQDEQGSLKEKSDRIRNLASEMIESYSFSTTSNAGVMMDGKEAEAALEARTSEPVVDSSPAEVSPIDAPSSPSARGFLPRWLRLRKDPEPTEPATMDLQGATSLLGGSSHTVGYRGLAAPMNGVPTAPAVAGERIVIAPPQQTWAEPVKRTSRLSQIFGY